MYQNRTNILLTLSYTILFIKFNKFLSPIYFNSNHNFHTIQHTQKSWIKRQSTKPKALLQKHAQTAHSLKQSGALSTRVFRLFQTSALEDRTFQTLSQSRSNRPGRSHTSTALIVQFSFSVPAPGPGLNP